MNPVLTLAWHEIRRMGRSPAFFFTLALFLFYQGIVFSVTVALRMHPLSPPGPLWAPFFGGPFWFWPMLLLVVVQLSHDAISRERAARTLDALRASPLTPGGIASGKFLALAAAWTLFWVATLPMFAAAWLLLPSDAVWEPGPILAGYAGVLLTGFAALAVGLFFSSLTSDARLSGMLTFLVLFTFVLLKILTHPAFGIVRHPTLVHALQAVNFLDMLERFARGFLHLRDLVLLGILTAGGVALAGRMLDGDFRRRLSWWHAADGAAWLALAVFATAWAARADVVWDARGQVEWDSRLVRRIESMEPVRLYLFVGANPTAEQYSPVSELEAYLSCLSRLYPSVSWERVAAVDESPRVRRLAQRFGIDLGALRSDASGLLEGRLVAAGSSGHHVMRLSDIFVLDVREDGVVFEGMALQAALAGALRALAAPGGSAWCFTRAHGEASIEDLRSAGLSRLARALSFAGIQTREIDLTAEVPSVCRLVAVFGPQDDLSPVEAENLERALARGRTGLVLAVRGGAQENRLPTSWQAARCGIRIGADVAADPEHPVHPPSGEEFFVSLPGRNQRLAVFLPRVLEISGDAAPLLTTEPSALRLAGSSSRATRSGWTLAAAAGPSCPYRALVLGFADAYFNERLSPAGASRNAETAWLIGRMRETAQEPEEEDFPLSPVEHYRLRLEPERVDRLHVFALLLWPAAALLLGIWAARRRR